MNFNPQVDIISCCQACDAGRSVPRPGLPALRPGLLHLPAQQGPGVPRPGRLRPVRQVEEGRGERPHRLQTLEAGRVTSRASNEGLTKVYKVFAITEKALVEAFSVITNFCWDARLKL